MRRSCLPLQRALGHPVLIDPARMELLMIPCQLELHLISLGLVGVSQEDDEKKAVNFVRKEQGLLNKMQLDGTSISDGLKSFTR